MTSFYQPSIPASSREKYVIEDKRITITGGASQNLACILQVFTDPGYTRNVWIISPGYMLAFRIFEDSGFKKKFRAVPEDEEGIDVEYLRKEISKSEETAKAEGNDEPVSSYFSYFEEYNAVNVHVLNLECSA